MKNRCVIKAFAAIAFLFALLIVLPAARASEFDQETVVTFNQAVQISGHVLPAGTYLFAVPNDISQHDVVRIFSPDRRKLYATVLTIYSQRSHPTDSTAFTLAERASDLPQAIVTWYYPGRTIGHEFLYGKQVQQELAKDQRVTVVSGD
jgi:hypothetical protein